MNRAPVALPAGAAARGNEQLLAEPLVALFCSIRCPWPEGPHDATHSRGARRIAVPVDGRCRPEVGIFKPVRGPGNAANRGFVALRAAMPV